MTLFLRHGDGSGMVDIEKAAELFIEGGVDGDQFVMARVDGVDFTIRSFTDRENAETFLRQIAARANASLNPEPISTGLTATVRSGPRFGKPKRVPR